MSLCGPPDAVRERLAVFRDAGVGTLMVSPMAWTYEERLRAAPARRRARSLRVLLGAFGDPGHAFPMLALGEALRGARATRWRCRPGGAGRSRPRRPGWTFAAAPEYQVFPTPERAAEAVRGGGAGGASRRGRWCATFAPDVAVSDILTPAPALAAELEGVPVATLVPHLYPHLPPGFPPYSIGARLPRTAVGRALWRAFDPLVARGLEQGRREYNECRARLGLGPLPYVHTGVSRSLTLVATLPQLEYPRDWPPWLRVVGPLMWEPPSEPRGAAAGLRPGRAGGAVDGAGSRRTGCCVPRWRAWPASRVRVIATWNGRARGPRCRRRRTPSWCRGCRTRGRCRRATSWSPTAATGR